MQAAQVNLLKFENNMQNYYDQYDLSIFDV